MCLTMYNDIEVKTILLIPSIDGNGVFISSQPNL
jgi:hypothetical protein